MIKTIRAGRVQLRVEDRGTGEPLVLVHGFPLDHTMWNGQIAGLADCCRVMAPDLRGFGGSDVIGPVATMEQMADDVAAVLDELEVDGPVDFCGLSMGGYVAWQFWRRHRRRVARLILCDTRAAADAPEAAAARLETAEAVLRDGAAAIADAMIEKLCAPQTIAQRPQVVDSLRKTMLATDRHGIAAALRGMAARPDSTPLLPEIDVPALVVVGRHDAISTVDEMSSIAAAISGAELAVIEGAGHMAPMEDPEQVNARIRTFLGR